MELILESDCETKSSEDKDTIHSGTNTNSDKNDIMDTTCTNVTQWTIHIIKSTWSS